ncbi:hypothetical protein FXO37_16583 [Capsicum annuum]|nr:hypothetical protein FXO37_16583 [Capsicum annuum]
MGRYAQRLPPTDALRPIILDNAYILCITAVAGTELADAYSLDTVIASSLGKEVHDPWAFYLHAVLLRQAFAHCEKFPTAASRRSLGRVSVPVWLIILSDQLLIIALPFPAVVPLPRAGSYTLLTHPPLEKKPRNNTGKKYDRNSTRNKGSLSTDRLLDSWKHSDLGKGCTSEAWIPPEEQGDEIASQEPSRRIGAADRNLDGTSLDSPAWYSSPPFHLVRYRSLDSLITWASTEIGTESNTVKKMSEIRELK